MARKKKSKRVPTAVAVSLVAHAALVFTLIYFLRSPPAPKHGVISVEFIEPVRHEPKIPRFREKQPAKAETPKPAPAAPAQPTVSVPQPVGDPDARARETDAYIQNILDLINKRKTYPRDSIEREEEGRVVLGVSLSADGRVQEVHVEESSRFQRLDQAALKIISEISSFPPLPPMLEAPLHLHIPIVYHLESRR